MALVLLDQRGEVLLRVTSHKLPITTSAPPMHIDVARPVAVVGTLGLTRGSRAACAPSLSSLFTRNVIPNVYNGGRVELYASMSAETGMPESASVGVCWRVALWTNQSIKLFSLVSPQMET